MAPNGLELCRDHLDWHMPNTHLFSLFEYFAQAEVEDFVHCVHPTAQLQPPGHATALPKSHSAAHKSHPVTQATCAAPA